MARSTKIHLNPAQAIAYCRVSTTDQALGREAQVRAIEEWAAREGVELVATFADEGVSGAAPLDRRPGMLDALAALREKGAGILVTARRDRLARDPVVAALIEREARRIGATIQSADGIGNGDEPGDLFVRRILDAFGEFERGLIALRTRAALHEKRAKGEFCGGRGAPYGYRLTADGRRIVPDAHEQRAIILARLLRERGCTLRAIGLELADRGFPPKRARAWSPKTVSNLLQSSAA